MLKLKKLLYFFPKLTLLLAMLAVVFSISMPPSAYADQVTGRRINMSSYDASAVGVTHTFTCNINTASSIGSLVFEYCTNSPLLELSCTLPTGLDVSGTAVSSQSGETGFSVHPDTGLTTNKIILTRAPAVVTPQQVTYSLNNINNPSISGTYFVRISTYATTDGSGAYTDRGGVAFHTSIDYSVQLYVPPWLEFCVGITITGNCTTASGNSLDLGDFSSNVTSSASSQFRANTNADNGYNVSVYGTTMTSGNNYIDALTSPTLSLKGSNQFGINLANNSIPDVGQDAVGPGVATVDPDYSNFNLYQFNSGDTIATVGGPSDNVTFTVSYIVNIAKQQAAGIYSTTMSYVCLATF